MSHEMVVGADSEACSKVTVPEILESPRTTATARHHEQISNGSLQTAGTSQVYLLVAVRVGHRDRLGDKRNLAIKVPTTDSDTEQCSAVQSIKVALWLGTPSPKLKGNPS